MGELEPKNKAVPKSEETARTTALISLSKAEKDRLSSIAKAHGLSLSSLFRLSAEEFIKNHDW